jgi:hypothetical protein
MTLPHGWHAQVRARFPVDRIGSSEPILTETVGSDVLLWYVTYLDNHRLRIACQAEGGGPLGSMEVTYDPGKEHEFEFVRNGTASGAHEPGESCRFDGAQVFSVTHPSSGLPAVLASGCMPANISGVSVRFTGSRLDLGILPETSVPNGSPAVLGAEHMIVRLPAQKTGRGEPLLVTGKTGAGDFIYVTYEDEKHIRIGYDHWAVGGVESDPIEVDYGVPHEIWISLGTLYPQAGEDAYWQGDAAARSRLTSTLSVILDGKTVLSSEAKPYPSTPDEVTIGKNQIGGSTCDAEFSGTIEFQERAGRLMPTQ